MFTVFTLWCFHSRCGPLDPNWESVYNCEEVFLISLQIQLTMLRVLPMISEHTEEIRVPWFSRLMLNFFFCFCQSAIFLSSFSSGAIFASECWQSWWLCCFYPETFQTMYSRIPTWNRKVFGPNVFWFVLLLYFHFFFFLLVLVPGRWFFVGFLTTYLPEISKFQHYNNLKLFSTLFYYITY